MQSLHIWQLLKFIPAVCSGIGKDIITIICEEVFHLSYPDMEASCKPGILKKYFCYLCAEFAHFSIRAVYSILSSGTWNIFIIYEHLPVFQFQNVI